MRALAPGRLFSVAALVAACASAPGTSPAPSASPAPSVTPPAAATPSTPAQTPTPGRTISPIPSPSEHEQQPPNMEIVSEDGHRVPAFQGSWCFDLSCLDNISAEKEDLPIVNATPGESLVAELDGSAPIGHWTASYGPEADSQPMTEIDEGGTYVDPDAEPGVEPQEMTRFAFVPVRVGDWVVVLNVQFAGGRGDGSYYWRVIIE